MANFFLWKKVRKNQVAKKRRFISWEINFWNKYVVVRATGKWQKGISLKGWAVESDAENSREWMDRYPHHNYWRQNSCHLITLSFLMKDITTTQEFTVFSLQFQTKPYILFDSFYMKFVSLCSIASNLYSYLIKLVTCHCNGYIIISILSLNFTVTIYFHSIHLIWDHSPSMH